VDKASEKHPGTTYTPTDREQPAIERVKQRRTRSAPAPTFNVEASTKAVNISPDHPDGGTWNSLLADTFGTGDFDFAASLAAQLADVSRSGKVPAKKELDYMLSVVRGINPRDETEAVLAAQMAAIHNATMVAARRLNHVETIAQQDSASNMLNKARADLREPGRGPQEIPLRRRADDQGPARHRQRWRPGHCRQRQPGGGGHGENRRATP
jgi:hypothetical protein